MLLVRRSKLVAAAATNTLPTASRSRQAMGTVAKGTAVHGLRSPEMVTLENKEEVEEIHKGREHKQKRREQVQDTVDSEISSDDSADRKSTAK